MLWSDFALQFDERRMKVFSVGQAEGPDGCAVAALHQFEQRANARERERESETSETAADRPRKIERERESESERDMEMEMDREREREREKNQHKKDSQKAAFEQWSKSMCWHGLRNSNRDLARLKKRDFT